MNTQKLTEKEMVVAHAFGDYLKHFRKGVSNAVTAKELKNHGWGNARKIRKFTQYLRVSCQLPVCANDRGYYYAETLAELKGCINRLSAMERNLFTSLRSLMVLYDEMKVAAERGEVFRSSAY